MTESYAWSSGYSSSVTAIGRPEAYLLLPVVVATFVLNRGRPAFKSSLKSALATLVVMGLLLLPWLLFAKLHLGHFLPNTAGAKSGGLVTNPVVFAEKMMPIIKIVG